MRRRSEGGHDWGIVLAGGSGTRLSVLTTNAEGVAVPKQYCSLSGSRPLLTEALERAGRVLPRERIVIVVAEEHDRYWRPALSGWPEPNVLVQPRNRGTAPGILLPLLSILERDARARVALFPSDHFVEHEDVLERSVRASLGALSSLEHVVLLGITPDSAEPDYGWIHPGQDQGVTSRVESFVEKPGVMGAIALQQRGAVWNSFLMVARGSSLIGLYERRLPGLLEAFRAARPRADLELARALYEHVEAADFSRDVLQGSESSLRLHVVPSCGWTDLGTPERVVRCLLRQRRRTQRSSARLLDPAVRRVAATLVSH